MSFVEQYAVFNLIIYNLGTLKNYNLPITGRLFDSSGLSWLSSKLCSFKTYIVENPNNIDQRKDLFLFERQYIVDLIIDSTNGRISKLGMIKFEPI